MPSNHAPAARQAANPPPVLTPAAAPAWLILAGVLWVAAAAGGAAAGCLTGVALIGLGATGHLAQRVGGGGGLLLAAHAGVYAALYLLFLAVLGKSDTAWAPWLVGDVLVSGLIVATGWPAIAAPVRR